MSLQSIVDICRKLGQLSRFQHPKFVEGEFNTVVDLLPLLETALKSKPRGMSRADQVAANGCLLRLRKMLGQDGLWAVGFFQQMQMLQRARGAMLLDVQRTMLALRPVLVELEPLAARAEAADVLGGKVKPRKRTASERRLTPRQTQAVELDAKHMGNATEAAREMGISRPAFIQHLKAGYHKMPADTRPKRLKRPRTQRLATDKRGGIVPSGGSKRRGGANLV